MINERQPKGTYRKLPYLAALTVICGLLAYWLYDRSNFYTQKADAIETVCSGGTSSPYMNCPTGTPLASQMSHNYGIGNVLFIALMVVAVVGIPTGVYTFNMLKRLVFQRFGRTSFASSRHPEVKRMAQAMEDEDYVVKLVLATTQKQEASLEEDESE